MSYQVYIDRHDGLGLVLNGCWGSEYCSFDNPEDAEEAARQLTSEYGDDGCDFVVVEE